MSIAQDLRNKYYWYKRQVDGCNDKLARLKPVYSKLGKIKEEFRSARKDTKAIFREKGTWRGEKYTAYCNAGEALDDACQEYYNRLDAAHDAINKEIGELEAARWRYIPIMNGLMRDIKDLETGVENALN